VRYGKQIQEIALCVSEAVRPLPHYETFEIFRLEFTIENSLLKTM
jgi:hypothetical protein